MGHPCRQRKGEGKEIVDNRASLRLPESPRTVRLHVLVRSINDPKEVLAGVADCKIGLRIMLHTGNITQYINIRRDLWR